MEKEQKYFENYSLKEAMQRVVELNIISDKLFSHWAETWNDSDIANDFEYEERKSKWDNTDDEIRAILSHFAKDIYDLMYGTINFFRTTAIKDGVDTEYIIYLHIKRIAKTIKGKCSLYSYECRIRDIIEPSKIKQISEL